MTFNASTDTPSSPPPSGFKLIGMKSDNTGDVFIGSDFLTKDAGGKVNLGLSDFYLAPDIGLGNPGINFDVNDFIDYDRSSNLMRFCINSSYYMVIGASSISPATDNAIALGAGSFRFSVLYAATGTINTSDAREKNWIASLDTHPKRQAYLAAAREIEAAMGLFQWGEAVSEKGADGARWHFGAVAQVVIDTFMAHGLEERASLTLPTDRFVPEAERPRPRLRHAMLCFDTWDEERAPETKTVRRTRGGKPVIRRVPTGRTIVTRAAGNRFGLRFDQLLAFLAAANGIMRRDLAARLAALEEQIGANG